MNDGSFVLFALDNYFMKTGLFYAENGNTNNRDTSINFPGAHKNIGNINLEKIDYYCKYLAIYSEEEISKITNITVEQIN